jgi:hypothetical protein
MAEEKIDQRFFYQYSPGCLPYNTPEDALWEHLRDPEIRAFALELVKYIKENLGERKYGEIEGLRVALLFIAHRF